MTVEHISFDQLSPLSKRDIDYQIRPEAFEEFLVYMPDENGLEKAIADRSSFKVNRTLLHSVIQRQYQGQTMSDLQADALESLKSESTFTVITAHQPALLLGPLYYVTKMFSTINLANKLSQNGVKVVPIFINGSEDHDFEEVNQVNLYGKKLQWAKQSGGAVGRYTLEGLADVIEEFSTILGQSDVAVAIKDKLANALEGAKTYNEFVFKLVNALFGQYGILVVNTDDAELKQEFTSVMKEELINRPSQALVADTQAKLEAKGYKAQAFPREINLFYLTATARERIVYEDGIYKVLNTDLTFTETELVQHLHEHADRFSPNVVLRPLYQEFTFPNIAYVGGGGELAYWMERKHQFKHFGIFFPVLMRRNSVMFIQKPHLKTLDKLGLAWQDLLQDVQVTTASYLQSKADVSLSLSSEMDAIHVTFDAIAQKGVQVDPTLKDAIEVERTKTVKQIEQIEGRLSRAMKKNEETNVAQIAGLYGKIFPNGGLQERTDNYLQYYLAYGKSLEDMMIEQLDPTVKGVVVFVDK